MTSAMTVYEEKEPKQITEDLPEKKGFVVWVKEYKVQLLLAGISVTALIMTMLGLKNKDDIKELWDSLKEEIKKGPLYSAKWFETATLEELEAAREVVQQDYRNPNLDLDYRDECWNLLTKFDKSIGKLQWHGTEYGYPAHSEHGHYLSSDE